MNNPWAQTENDKVYIVNQSGKRQGPYKARVKSGEGKAFITENIESLEVEDGYKLVRELPNAKEETYTIIEVNYKSSIAGALPPRYELQIRKDTSLKKNNNINSQTFNFNDSSYIQIGDHNVQNVINMLQDLTHKIDSTEASPEEKAQAKELLATFLRHPIVTSVLGGAGTELAKQLIGG